MKNLLSIFLFFSVLASIGINGCVNDAKNNSPVETAVDSTYLSSFTRMSIVLSCSKLYQSGVNSADISFDSTRTFYDWNKNFLKAGYTDSGTWTNQVGGGEWSQSVDKLISGAQISYSGNYIDSGYVQFYGLESHSYRQNLGLSYRFFQIRYNSIPLISKDQNTMIFELSGTPLRSHIMQVIDTSFTSQNNSWSTDKLLNIIWDQQPTPRLRIIFYR